jgi:hypothetical protein
MYSHKMDNQKNEKIEKEKSSVGIADSFILFAFPYWSYFLLMAVVLKIEVVMCDNIRILLTDDFVASELTFYGWRY